MIPASRPMWSTTGRCRISLSRITAIAVARDVSGSIVMTRLVITFFTKVVIRVCMGSPSDPPHVSAATEVPCGTAGDFLNFRWFGSVEHRPLGRARPT